VKRKDQDRRKTKKKKTKEKKKNKKKNKNKKNKNKKVCGQKESEKAIEKNLTNYDAMLGAGSYKKTIAREYANWVKVF
jgi:hypothetical protein